MKKRLILPVAMLSLLFAACNNAQPEKTSADTTPNAETVSTQQPTEDAKESVGQPVGGQQAQEQPAEESENKEIELSTFEKLTKGNIKVKGSADIVGFCEAILPIANAYYSYEDNKADMYEGMDKKAGYWSQSEEGGGSIRMECCFWNRTDKKKLVAYSEDVHDLDVKGNVTYKTCLCFFLYNEATKELEPIEAPINGSFEKCVNEGDHISVKLPQKGKDIKYTVGEECWGEAVKTLKWNGMGFDKM